MAAVIEFDDPARIAPPDEPSPRTCRMFAEIVKEESVRIQVEIWNVISGARKSVDLCIGAYAMSSYDASDLWDVLAEEIEGNALYVLWVETPEHTALKGDAIARIAGRTAQYIAENTDLEAA